MKLLIRSILLTIISLAIIYIISGLVEFIVSIISMEFILYVAMPCVFIYLVRTERRK